VKVFVGGRAGACEAIILPLVATGKSRSYSDLPEVPEMPLFFGLAAATWSRNSMYGAHVEGFVRKSVHLSGGENEAIWFCDWRVDAMTPGPKS